MNATNNTTSLEDCIPLLDAATNEGQEIDALLDAISHPSLIVSNVDVDRAIDAALCALLDFDRLPERTVDAMLVVLSVESDDDLTLTKKMAATDVLGHMGKAASKAISALGALTSLAKAERAFERWLALRSSQAVWRISGEARPAGEVAIMLLKDDEFWLVAHAANLLQSVGPEATSRVRELLDHEEEGMREAAQRALQILNRS